MTPDELDTIRRRLDALPDAAPTLQRLVDAIDERDARIAALEDAIRFGDDEARMAALMEEETE